MDRCLHTATSPVLRPVIAWLVVAAGWYLCAATPALAQDDALAPLRQAVATQPGNAAAHAELGHALLRVGQLNEAERAFRRAASLSPKSVAAAYDALRVIFERGDHRAARGACGRFKAVAKGTPYEHLCFARAFLILRRSSRATEYLESALALDADHVESLLTLGDADRMSGKIEDAARSYERARALSDRAEAYFGLARVAIARGDHTQARTLLHAAEQRAPGWPAVMLELGRLTPGRDGLDLLRRAVALRPGWDATDLALTEALLEAGETTEAETFAAQLAARSPELAEAHTLLGRARHAQGDTSGAEQAYNRALELVPNLPEATLALADVLAATERAEEAFAEYQKAAGLRPLDSQPLLRAARLALRLGRHNLATAFLDKALDRTPNAVAALSLYGDVHRTRGDKPQARAMYERALTAANEDEARAIREAMQKL